MNLKSTNSMKTIGSILFFATLCLAGQDTHSIPVMDSSRSGSPVTISGTQQTTEEAATQRLNYWCKVDLAATNKSGKGILLLIVKIEGVSEHGVEIPATEIDDYLFSPRLFEAGTTETFHSSLGPIGFDKNSEGEFARPTSVTAGLVYAQFVDGSSWGDSKAAKAPLTERRLTRLKLEHFAKVYETEGDQRFLTELMRPCDLQTVEYLQHLHAVQNNDATTIYLQVTKMLSNAKVHGVAIGG